MEGKVMNPAILPTVLHCEYNNGGAWGIYSTDGKKNLGILTIPMQFLRILQMLKSFLENIGAGRLVLNKDKKTQMCIMDQLAYILISILIYSVT